MKVSDGAVKPKSEVPKYICSEDAEVLREEDYSTYVERNIVIEKSSSLVLSQSWPRLKKSSLQCLTTLSELYSKDAKDLVRLVNPGSWIKEAGLKTVMSINNLTILGSFDCSGPFPSSENALEIREYQKWMILHEVEKTVDVPPCVKHRRSGHGEYLAIIQNLSDLLRRYVPVIDVLCFI